MGIGAATTGLIWKAVQLDVQDMHALAQLFGPVQVALDYAGRCCVPTILMCLGAKLVNAVGESWSTKGRSLRIKHSNANMKLPRDAQGPGHPELVGIPEDQSAEVRDFEANGQGSADVEMEVDPLDEA